MAIPRTAPHGNLKTMRKMMPANSFGRAFWRPPITSASVSRFLPQPRPTVVKLKEGSTEVPLYFIGGGLNELRLSQMMKADRAIYAVEVPWPSAWRHVAHKNETAVLPDMEGLAALYTKALSTHIGSSRCVLAGISFCGLIAFEVAHQLNNAGLKVEMVMLLDTQAIYPTPRRLAWQKLINDWRNYQTRKSLSRRSEDAVLLLSIIYSTIYSLFLAAVRSSVRCLNSIISDDTRYPTTKLGNDGIPWQFASIRRVYARAIRSYRLCPLDCRGVLFRANLGRKSGPCYRWKPGLERAVCQRLGD